jgi:hypothetical protein
MTVYASKPEINVREKLKELEFNTIPYDKLPSGTVVDVQQTRFDTRLNIDHGGGLSYYAFTDLDIVMYPKSINSKFHLTGHVVSGERKNPNGGPSFAYYIESGGRQFGPHDASNHTATWQLNDNSFVSIDDLINDAFTTSATNSRFLSKTYHGSVIFEPQTTKQVTFQLGFHGKTTFDVNRNDYTGGIYGSGWTTLTVMEVL